MALAQSGHKPPRLALRVATLAAAAYMTATVWTLGTRSIGWATQGWRPGGGASLASRGAWGRQLQQQQVHRELSRAQVAAAATDTFDPWTVLGISPSAGKDEARKAYKKLIATYHPDVDPSTEAEVKFQQVVRAHAVVTGEDKELDTATLLTNAVENLRNDMEFKKQNIEQLKAQAAAEEQEMLKMQEQLETAKVQRNKVTQELGAFGGGAIGFLVGGPGGLFVGAAIGLAFKDRDDAIGQVVRGTGTVVKGVADAVGRAVKPSS